MTNQLHTIAEAADLLGGISTKTVYRLIAAGDLGSCDVAPSTSRGSMTRVSDAHIAAFIAARSRKGAK